MATDIRSLVIRFEPIIHFHAQERFFPSDAKRYFEQSELWNAVGDNSVNLGVQRTLKDNWGSQDGNRRIPMLARGEIATEITELGTFIGTTGTFVADDGLQERFLDPAGWRGGDIVDSASENGYADLDRLAVLYDSAAAQGGDDVLSGSRFWYHAEFFSADRLKVLLDDHGGQDRNELAKLFDDATQNPALLCYYELTR